MTLVWTCFLFWIFQFFWTTDTMVEAGYALHVKIGCLFSCQLTIHTKYRKKFVCLNYCMSYFWRKLKKMCMFFSMINIIIFPRVLQPGQFWAMAFVLETERLANVKEILNHFSSRLERIGITWRKYFLVFFLSVLLCVGLVRYNRYGTYSLRKDYLKGQQHISYIPFIV